MRFSLFRPVTLASVTVAAACSFVPTKAPADTNYGQIGLYVATMLQTNHYTRQDIDDEISAHTLDLYIDTLDFKHLYFTQKDIDEFNALYRTKLDDQILIGDIGAAEKIYNRFMERVTDRTEKIKALLENPDAFTFDSGRTTEVSRKDAAFPKDIAEADTLWHDIIEGELLQEKLRRLITEQDKTEKKAKKDAKEIHEDIVDPSGEPPPTAQSVPTTPVEIEVSLEDPEDEKPAEEKILRRYTRFVDNLKENGEEEIVNLFLTSLSSAYDPHSDWFSQSEWDNFMISMKNALVGIGALLSMKDDGLTEIQGLIIGGPAAGQGELKVGDKILGVGQGKEGEFVDVAYMRLQKVVEMIRGKKGSVVRLKVADADDQAVTRVVPIVRDEVKLKDKLATAQVIDMHDSAGETVRLGWIELPSFYADMQERTTTATADVKKLLTRLMEENISGLILDLRGNGGGSLEEAVDMTGLFVDKGPVVQIKDYRGKIRNRITRNKAPFYNGPLVVLTDKASASASEIVAAALQDYNRAIIVGEKSSFGKGTVQTILQVASQMPFFSDKENAGALKVTIQKFYRIAGGSTQLKGVVPDLQFPSRRDALDIGEDSLDGPLPYDEIPAQPFKLWKQAPLTTDLIRSRHVARVAEDPEFGYVIEDRDRLQKQFDDNILSLNEAARLAEVEDGKARREQREDERRARNAALTDSDPEFLKVYRLTLDNVDDDELQLASSFTDEDSSGMILKPAEDLGAEEEEDDGAGLPYDMAPEKLEALNVLQDMIALGSTVAKAE